MNDITSKIILDPPKSDIVFIFSAAWPVWVCLGLILLAIIIAVASKKKPQ